MFFKPSGIPKRQLSEIVLEIDELEAVRLADKEGLYHEDAARRMNVSRQTFGRIIASARRKIAEALIGGCALRIEGGEVDISLRRKFMCIDCNYEWETVDKVSESEECPECESKGIETVDDDDNVTRRGWRGGGHRRGAGRGRNRR
ncbi:MAG TPA: DUF134 domain-containing protein [Firmicutes bacterium]|nr:DUF134 domain-containing protein [Bacillota bacterium]